MARKLTRGNLRLVVVENDENDLFFLKRALERGGFLHPLIRLKDGIEAIAYFEKMEQPTSQLPDVVLMDIQMPGKDGLEVLEWIRAHPLLKELPVMMLTSSDEPTYLRKSQRLGALKFLTKRIHCDNVISALEGFLAVYAASEESQ